MKILHVAEIKKIYITKRKDNVLSCTHAQINSRINIEKRKGKNILHRP